MSTVVKTDDAIFAIKTALNYVATDIQVAIDVMEGNAGGLLFGSWATGAVPANAYFHNLSPYECLGIGLAAAGFGVPGVPKTGREGIYLKSYIDSPPILLEWKMGKPGFVSSMLKDAELSQKKARLRCRAVKGNEDLGSLLLRVPHS
jgi:hypothetical protein